VAARAAPEDTEEAAVPAGVATTGIVDADPPGDTKEHPDSATTARTATAIDRRTRLVLERPVATAASPGRLAGRSRRWLGAVPSAGI
jgi:hypothetical protein